MITYLDKQFILSLPNKVPTPMHPWQLLLYLLALGLQKKQAVIIDYLLEENKILREKLPKQRYKQF
jgi:hypothetical protein